MAAVRDKNVVRLYLYIDGLLNSSSTTFAEADYDISNRSQFLMGFGPTVLLMAGVFTMRQPFRNISTVPTTTRRQFLKATVAAGAVVCGSPALLQGRNLSNPSSAVTVNSRPQLVAHWKLDGDCRDALGNHHGNSSRLTFEQGVDSRAGGAAVFNGTDSTIEVPDADDLNFGTEPFSILLWLKLKEEMNSAPGDIISKFDAPLRRGFNLSLLGNSSGYSSYGDREGLHFGIDNGISGSWLDHSRPWKTNPVITTLTVYKGELYAAIGDASRAEDACHVFRFAGGEKWIDCGRVGNNPLTLSVFSTVVHKGKFLCRHRNLGLGEI